jgi:hypothetical protein
MLRRESYAGMAAGTDSILDYLRTPTLYRLWECARGLNSSGGIADFILFNHLRSAHIASVDMCGGPADRNRRVRDRRSDAGRIRIVKITNLQHNSTSLARLSSMMLCAGAIAGESGSVGSSQEDSPENKRFPRALVHLLRRIRRSLPTATFQGVDASVIKG